MFQIRVCKSSKIPFVGPYGRDWDAYETIEQAKAAALHKVKVLGIKVEVGKLKRGKPGNVDKIVGFFDSKRKWVENTPPAKKAA